MAGDPDEWVRRVDEESAWCYGPAFGPAGYVITHQPANPAASFEDAYALVLAQLIGDETNRLQLSASRQPLRAGSTTLTTWGGREVIAPWNEYWLFFADDDPVANWAHPCRYIFVARDLSAIAVQRAMTPLNLDLEVLIRYEPPPFPETKRLPGVRASRAINCTGSVSNCYAVIISGGSSPVANATRFWGDAAAVYSTLTRTYGYPKTNIFTYISDGTNPAVDAVDYILYDYVNSPVDLDGDGLADTLGEASSANVSNVFLYLQGVLQSNDQLFVFVTDHGGHTAGGAERDSALALWNEEVFRDTEMEALTTNIPCPILFVMEQCFSGGFIDNLDQPQRVIATAAAYNNTSSGGDTYLWYDQWCYEWISAMRGFYPVTNQPWANSTACNADFNGDGFVSFREASHYANLHAPPDDTPQYNDAPEYLGSRLFLMQPTSPVSNLTDWVELASFKTPLATNVLFNARITARDPLGNCATNFSGPVTLEAVADIVERGKTVGNASSPYTYLMRTDHRTVRTQAIYPAGMMDGAREIEMLSLEVDTIPTQTLQQFTIRMRHTDLDVYPLAPTQVVWETEDWTTVYQGNRDITTNGWVTFVFTNTFAYDGIHGLMVDFSFSNDFSTESATIRPCFDWPTTKRSIYCVSDGEYGDPLSWSGTNPAPTRTYHYPYVRFGLFPYQPHVAIVPTNLTDFTDGVWTGTLTALNAADNVRILVHTTNSYWDTETDRFSIRGYLFNLVDPQFNADGSFVLNWNSGTGYTYRVLRSTNLLNGFETYATNLSATPPLNTFTGLQPSAASDFFCVEEE
ncbi:MAG: C13 family peptidase [Kiritimatiellae bacterium]|nr:C13 family peptidase [Kiritimatiellia bacterium]